MTAPVKAMTMSATRCPGGRPQVHRHVPFLTQRGHLEASVGSDKH